MGLQNFEKMGKKILLSGIQPSGNFHIGNYLGAIKRWVDLQKSYRVLAMVADLHAITIPQEPKILEEKSLEAAKLLFACGMDPKKSLVFLQSQVPAHTELAWILNTITPVGELERMTQFKEKKGKAGALAGLLNYPVLQAADILIYKTEAVPVGEDQLQHLELTRTLANKFNNRFGKTFEVPKALVQKETARIMALDDPSKKMSKSASNPENYIALLDSPAGIRRKIKVSVTDSGKEVRYDPNAKPAVSNLMTIYSAFSGQNFAEIEKKYANAGYAEFKTDLAELLVRKLAPIQKKYRKLSEDKKTIIEILHKNAKEASSIANRTLLEVKKKVGFVL